MYKLGISKYQTWFLPIKAKQPENPKQMFHLEVSFESGLFNFKIGVQKLEKKWIFHFHMKWEKW